jgi:hypothetical protein
MYLELRKKLVKDDQHALFSRLLLVMVVKKSIEVKVGDSIESSNPSSDSERIRLGIFFD